MKRIKLSRELESITFQQNHSQADEWRSIHQPSGTGATDWTTEQVKQRVDELTQKGWKKS